MIGHDFDRPPAAGRVLADRLMQGIEGGLRGGGKYDAGMVCRRQVRQRRQCWHGQMLRQALRLIEQDHRLHQIVQLAAARRSVGEQ